MLLDFVVICGTFCLLCLCCLIFGVCFDDGCFVT